MAPCYQGRREGKVKKRKKGREREIENEGERRG